MNRFTKIIYFAPFSPRFLSPERKIKFLPCRRQMRLLRRLKLPIHEGDHVLVSPSALTVFNIGWFPVTNSMICTWIVALIIFVIVRVTTWKVKEIRREGKTSLNPSWKAGKA
ncbi:MAG: hypothetical protein WDN00_13905 [Limisphaerales bacterium]